MCGSFQIRAHMRYYVKRSSVWRTEKSRYTCGQVGMMTADRTAAALLQHVVYARVESQGDGEDPFPSGDLLALHFPLDRLFQLGRLVAARSFRDQSRFLVVLDVEIFQRQSQSLGEQFLQPKLHFVLARLVAADAAARY